MSRCGERKAVTVRRAIPWSRVMRIQGEIKRSTNKKKKNKKTTERKEERKENKKKERTTPRVPTWSPTAVLTRPERV